MSPDEELRLECLRLACGLGRGEEVDLARAFYAFATGQDEKTTRETILAALEAAGVT